MKRSPSGRSETAASTHLREAAICVLPRRETATTGEFMHLGDLSSTRAIGVWKTVDGD